MVVTKITSGLGNQLFQYAIAKNLSIQRKTSLYFDLSYFKYNYDTDTPRKFKLNHFNIDYKLLDNSPLLYFSKATKLFSERSFKPFFVLLKEKQFHFDDTVLRTNSNHITLDGFWQSEKYFTTHADTIREELIFKTNTDPYFKVIQQKILTTEVPISIHLRRGDYVNNSEFSQKFGFIGLDYYEQAVNFMRERFQKHRFFIFSDDSEWVKHNFKLDADTVYVASNGENCDVSDLQLMSLCHHQIIANSSFSWWGAWLNPKKNKLIIAPKQWYKNQPSWDTKDLLPSNWIRL